MSETNKNEALEGASCGGECGSCASAGTCGGSGEAFDPESLIAKPNAFSDIRHAIAVVSGKGGVGKSLITGLLAVTMARKNYHVGILDADITGPSIPKMFGVNGTPRPTEAGVYPITTARGIDIMSTNLILENKEDPVVWRGPILGGMVKQFWQEIIWEDIDYLFLDMPPGTGDVPLTVFQSIKVDGIVIVTSPQELVSMIVAKAVKMAEMMKVPIIGLVENMSYFKCPDCGKEHKIYGESHISGIAAKYNLDVLARIPIEPQLAARCDLGQIEMFDGDWLDEVAKRLIDLDKAAE